MCERWVGDWTNSNILTPSSFVFSSTSFSFCWVAQSGVPRAHSPLLGAGSLYNILSPTNWLQLTEPVCGPGLYNCLTSTCFLWASHLHPIHPVHSQGYTLVSSTGCTCYVHRCISYLSARPRVNIYNLRKRKRKCLLIFYKKMCLLKNWIVLVLHSLYSAKQATINFLFYKRNVFIEK